MRFITPAVAITREYRRRLRRVPHAVGETLRTQPPTSLRFTSYSGRDVAGIPLDLKLLHLLDWRDGFFIEAGANDGLFSSNTALFERHFGWSGILVEPAPRACERCRANRRAPVHNCALVSFQYSEETVAGDFDGHPMASVGGDRMDRESSYRVPARTLQSLIDEHGVDHVDLLSLDTEGYELEVLRGIDFERVDFSHMVIELYPSNLDETIAFLGSRGYDLVGNYSNYNTVDYPEWDGTQNDYLFSRRGLGFGRR